MGDEISFIALAVLMIFLSWKILNAVETLSERVDDLTSPPPNFDAEVASISGDVSAINQIAPAPTHDLSPDKNQP